MKNIKRSISIFLTIIISLIACFSLAACWSSDITRDPGYEDKEIGDFVFRFYDSSNYCSVTSVSGQGIRQRFLVVPAYVEGREVWSWGSYNPYHGFPLSNCYYYPVYMTSDKLEKIYFTRLKNYHPAVTTGSCPNLEKVIYLDFFSVPWDFGGQIYFPQKRYETLKAYPTFEIYALPANVSYYYNCENPKNGGYYWIDDCDYGGKIEFIPPEPEREGYEFDGWYKEPECINKWDFETDTLPEKQTEMQENLYGEEEVVTVYQETILYAKWIKTDSPDNC